MTIQLLLLASPSRLVLGLIFFFFNDRAAAEIYTLSLHDALPISARVARYYDSVRFVYELESRMRDSDRKSTRLNSSHEWISYAVFCLKKKKIEKVYNVTGYIDLDDDVVKA